MAFLEEDDHWQDFAHFAQQMEEKVLSGHVDQERLLDKLRSAQCNRERVRICLDEQQVEHNLTGYASFLRQQMVSHEKSDEEAQAMRQQGNQLFKEKQYADALEAYSAAIAKAETKNSASGSTSTDQQPTSELATCISNRSAVLFTLRNFDQCMQDIQLAIDCGYQPVDKLLTRKQQCEQMIAQQKDIDRLTTGNESEPTFTADNPLIGSTSNKVAIKRDPVKGRLIQAKEDIGFGEKLLQENPFAFLLDHQYYLAFCAHCMQQLHGRGLPCQGCDHVLYCSDNCRLQADKSYHPMECNRTLDLQSDIGIAYLTVRILFTVGIDKILSLDWNDLQSNQSNDACKPYSADYTSILSLMSHETEIEPKQNLFYIFTAILIKCVLQQLNVVLLSDREQEEKLCTVLLLHLQQMNSNLVSSVNHVFLDPDRKDGLVGGEQMNVGVAFYPALSLFNHSCKPNVISLFQGSQVTLSAACRVRAGEELFFCYGPSVQNSSRQDRQQALRQQYFFDCRCTACESGAESKLRAFLCCDCNGALIVNRDKSNKCLNCRKQNQPVSIELYASSMAAVRQARVYMQQKNYDQALDDYVQAYQQLTDCLHRHNLDLRRCLEDICQCYAMLGHFKIAAEYCGVVLKITREVFGAESVEAASERVKLNSLRLRVIENLELDEQDRAVEMSRVLMPDIEDTIAQFERLSMQVKEKLTRNQLKQFDRFAELEILEQMVDRLRSFKPFD